MQPRIAMSSLSLFVGIGAVIFIFFGMSVPMGALGVIMALISRGNGELDGKAIGGLVISIIAILIGIAMVVASYLLINNPAFSEFMSEYEAIYDLYAGGAS